jgi:hypothetical protein
MVALLAFAGGTVVGGNTGVEGVVVVVLSREGVVVFVMVPSEAPFTTGTVVEFPPGGVVTVSPITFVTFVKVFVSFPLGTGAALGCMVLPGGNVVVMLGPIDPGFCEFEGSNLL